MNHYKVVCKQCETIMSQCRCPDPNKKVYYEICEKCKSKVAEKSD